MSGWSYEEQEEIKKMAWHILLDKNADPITKARAALYGLIAAHYWRAKELVDGAKAPFRRRVHGHLYSRTYELSIEVYTENWLWANGETTLGPEVLAAIRDVWHYVPVKHEMLPKGKTMYGERGAYLSQKEAS